MKYILTAALAFWSGVGITMLLANGYDPVSCFDLAVSGGGLY